MQKLIFRNGNGVEVNLTSGNFGITNWKGFDNAGLNIQSQTVPFTDGSVFIDALLNNRELSVTVALQDNGDLEKRYELKRELIKILNPKLGEGVLTYTNDFLSKQIKVVPSIPLFQNKNSNDRGTQKGTLVFTACNPYWEDTEETVVNLKSGERQTVENKGDVPCQIKAVLDMGIKASPFLQNLTQNKKIALKGSYNTGVEISTEFGNKHIKGEQLAFKIDFAHGEFKSICYSDYLAKYIGVGNGFISFSTDLINWNTVDIACGNLVKVIYSVEKKLFVAVGDEIWISADGENWEKANTPTHSLNDVIYDEYKNIFIANYESGFVSVSLDGRSWSETSLTYPSVLCYSEDFIFAGLHKSTDGLSWVDVEGISGTPTDIKFIQDKYIIVTGTKIYQSEDAETWTEKSSGTGKIYFSNGLYYLRGSVGGTSGIHTSTDLTSWTSYAVSGIQSFYIADEFNIITYDGSKYYIKTSTDLTDWNTEAETKKTLKNFLSTNKGLSVYGEIIERKNSEWHLIYNTYNFGDITSFCKGGNITLAVADEGIFYTEDLKTWNAVDLSSFYDANITELNLMCCTYKDGLFIIAGTKILTSTDCEHWTERYSTFTGLSEAFINAISISNSGRLVTSGGVPYRIYGTEWTYSDDGITWNVAEDSEGNPITNAPCYCMVYSPELDKFIALSYFGTILTSTDGAVWEEDTQVEGNPQYATYMIYSQKEKIFIANSSQHPEYGVYISHNGEWWDNELIYLDGVQFGLDSIFYSSAYGLYLGISGKKIVISSDHINWSEIGEISTSQYWATSNPIFEDDKTILIGSINSLFTSYFKEAENLIADLTEDSDMNLGLEIGDNVLLISGDGEEFNATLTFRNKYLGV